MISNMCLKFKHSHVSIIMLFLFQCFNSSSSSSTTPGFHGNQLVVVADNGMNKQIKCIETERHALLDFKAMIFQHPYDCLSTWGTKKEDVDNDCCNWHGVMCNNQTGHVTELDLGNCLLEGEISPSLLNLTYLTLLDLSHNSFNGTIPVSIGSLIGLKYLDLSSNSFSGTIPMSIGSLTELWYLDLSASSLSGTIPESIGSMTELTALHLVSNSLSGSIPESIGSLTKLRELYLGYNLFNGSIPKSIGSLTELWKLDLSYNSFSGNVPKSIGSLTKLRDLSLSYNSFSGTIPREFGNLVNLESLRLDDLGRCSVENISWLSRLSHLGDLGMNGISLAKADHWVNAILSLQNLTWLVLDGCDLSQVMHPYSSSSSSSSSHVNSSSSNIVNLYLSNNNFNSSIYSWLYLLTSNRLEYLDLSGNKLDRIPKYLGNLCSLAALIFQNNSALLPFSDFMKTLSAGCTSHTLQYLNASSSQLTGLIPDDIQKISSLEVLDLAHNKLNGTISEKIWELPMLDRLDISSNSLSGAIFEKTGKLKPAYIDFSNNLLQGVFSDSFYGPVTNVSSTLNILNLSRNKLYGGISFLCHIVDGSLTYLDLSHNSFFGQIPDCLWHSIELRVLNLAHNNLSGRLPASIKHLFQLEVLYLYNNNFSGELPLSLGNCTKITFLDLGANKFSGNVPIWIAENLSGLYVLNLGTNNFFGPIPLQFCQLVNLQILDFSVNGLNGTIPSCVNNLTSLVHEGFLPAHDHRYYIRDYRHEGYEYRYYTDRAMVQWQGIRREFTNNLGLLTSIDLSSNNLTGRIPNELTDLRGLLALNLSKNALYGEIPEKIAHVKELLTLDLSRNHFSGRIPRSLSEITSLNCLDLSYNNLSGKIPSGNQLRTFEASSYTGNAGLCGLPLSKYCPGYEKLPVPSPVREGDIDELERWFYIGGAIGFSIGFWTVCSTLLINRRGRHTFFHFLGTLEDWVFVKVVVFKGKFQVIAQ